MGFATILIFKKWLCFMKRTKHPLPPGPTGYPIVGCLPQMMKNKPAFRWIDKLMQEINSEIACIRLGNTHVIVVTSPELAREFLRKQDAVFASRPNCMSGNLTSNGFLTAAISPMGDQWKKMRKNYCLGSSSPAICTKGSMRKECEEADHLVRYVYEQSSRNPLANGLVNVRVAAQHYCGNVTRKLVFSKRFFGVGTEDGGPGMEENEHVNALFTILKYLYGFAIGDHLPWLEVFDLDGCKRILKDAIKSLKKYHDPEIDRRVEMWRQGMRKTEEDILDVLINLKDSKNNWLLSIEEIKAQIIEIMLAAIDNPSNAVEWALAEMINQPDILDKACKELDQVAPFNVPHVSMKETTVGGYFIPKNSYVLLSRSGLGRNPRIWEDPLIYRPERHIVNKDSEVTLMDHDLRMISFSTGRRGCSGVLLGSTMTIILLARLIQGFSWSSRAPNNIDLTESEGNLQMAKPLIAYAMPRLEPHVYLKLM
ncbi:Tryptophan N-monooxygenase [Sesamum alatum]|uniref:Tryptophan N-monooxygenase n=1 Tax=Sesamum alatum TaxID=300844 RepID=A0AAE1XZD5_9LAMI|nr:Tryptophan N-monooxygenase [Sesamum alatum]